MIQFLIRRTDGEWFDLHVDRFAAVLKPTSIASRVIEGWGEHRIEVSGCEISFFLEDPGIHVCVESGEISQSEAQRLVEEIASNVTSSIGQQSRVVPL